MQIHIKKPKQSFISLFPPFIKHLFYPIICSVLRGIAENEKGVSVTLPSYELETEFEALFRDFLFLHISSVYILELAFAIHNSRRHSLHITGQLGAFFPPNCEPLQSRNHVMPKSVGI